MIGLSLTCYPSNWKNTFEGRKISGFHIPRIRVIGNKYDFNKINCKQVFDFAVCDIAKNFICRKLCNVSPKIRKTLYELKHITGSILFSFTPRIENYRKLAFPGVAYSNRRKTRNYSHIKLSVSILHAFEKNSYLFIAAR